MAYKMVKLNEAYRGHTSDEHGRVTRDDPDHNGTPCRLVWFPDGEQLWVPSSILINWKCTHPLTRPYGDSRCPDCDEYIGG